MGLQFLGKQEQWSREINICLVLKALPNNSLKGKHPLVMITMFGTTLRCILFAGLCLSDPSSFAGDQVALEAEGSPVLRRFNVTSPTQLEKALGKALVRAPCGQVSDMFKINFILESWPRYLASYPDPRRYLLPLQLDSIAYQVAIRRLPDARLSTHPSTQLNDLEHVLLNLDLPLFVSHPSGDPGLRFRLGRPTSRLDGGPQYRSHR